MDSWAENIWEFQMVNNLWKKTLQRTKNKAQNAEDESIFEDLKILYKYIYFIYRMEKIIALKGITS